MYFCWSVCLIKLANFLVTFRCKQEQVFALIFFFFEFCCFDSRNCVSFVSAFLIGFRREFLDFNLIHDFIKKAIWGRDRKHACKYDFLVIYQHLEIEDMTCVMDMIRFGLIHSKS